MRKAALLLMTLVQLAPTPLRASVVQQVPLPVGKCVNTGNHLETPSEDANGQKRLEAADFVRIRAAGFDTVRIPVDWYKHSASAPPYRIEPKWLDRVDEVVRQALAAHLHVILDSHNFNLVHSNPAEGSPWLGEVWRQVAAHFARQPTSQLWFEIENEPHDKLTNANLMATLGPALAAIRESNPDRPVVIGGQNWSGIDSLATLDLPDDPHVYATFHYYEPFAFTHQGAGWVNPSPPLGRHYGLPEDKARLITDAAKVDAFVARTGRVPFIGESGAFESVPLAERADYLRAISTSLAPHTSGLCVWAYTNTFPMWDHVGGHWLPGMLEAIGLPGEKPSKSK